MTVFLNLFNLDRKFLDFYYKKTSKEKKLDKVEDTSLKIHHKILFIFQFLINFGLKFLGPRRINDAYPQSFFFCKIVMLVEIMIIFCLAFVIWQNFILFIAML